MAIPSSTRIAYNTVYSQVHANVYNLLNTRSNVTDPVDSTGARKFVYVRMPNVDSRNFEGYPFIIVNHISVSQSRPSADTTRADMTYDIDVQVYSQDKDSNSSGDPSGAEQLNTISNNILKTINANRITLINYGMAHFELTGSDFDYDEIEDKMLYMREFSITFKSRLKVTA